MSKRVTVKIEYSRNTFFEKLLKLQHQEQEDRKLKYVLHKAHENLKKCPFEIQNIVDLKNVQGIGENIASKLEETWNVACREHKEQILTLKKIKKFTSEDYKRFQNNRKSTTELMKEAKRQEKQQKSSSSKVVDDDEFVSDGEDDGDQNILTKRTKTTSLQISRSSSFKRPTSVNASLFSNSGSVPSSSSDPLSFRVLTCKPFEQPTVYLIADNREHRNNPRIKSVIEHLIKKEDIRVDIRSLSVGDYIWVCRKIDGSEIVLDWVVERKTWDDLQSSIRGGRYDEQKARLGMAPMKNRVYLIEAPNRGDVACEQAVASTLSNGGYLIQRCADTRDTAAFLKEVTVRLQNKAAVEEISGVPFSQLQNLLQKKKAETVKDAWTRQLMVCPGMSQSRAEAIADRFPSMPALLKFFRANGDDAPIRLLHILPQLTRPITRNLFKFFIQ
ncbi:CRE-MUS-81 protein [Caenorhabditis remanei]|uniref:Crossover junction endonuclease MUS81 n=1 Tax=Caenorhabditis remanei TaxID=31234 RepID=E3MGJ6_CAERE|nr:CRE-MUS-81 protein [Caenorhabditis remanei]